VLFSSPRVRALSEAVERGVTPLPDIDPRLTALERQGKGVFERSCAQCHGGAGQSTTLPNGATERRTTSDPGRALLTGFVGGPPSRDDWGKLDMPGLRGLARTAPYFHNNSADTLEAVVDHYIEFFKLVKVTVPPGTPLPSFASSDGVSLDRAVTAEERAALAAYMRKL
jgi:cytochrome c peroxidase